VSPRVLLEVPITFDVGAQMIHSPMIEVEVGGTMTRLIVDTGSTDHVLTMELAERAGKEASPGEAGTDSVGASVPSWALGEVPVRIGNLDLRLRDVVAIAGPDPFQGWGIGGFLSPQHVHPTQPSTDPGALSRGGSHARGRRKLRIGSSRATTATVVRPA